MAILLRQLLILVATGFAVAPVCVSFRGRDLNSFHTIANPPTTQSI